MIEAIAVKIDAHGNIIIASGAFLGHFCGSFTAMPREPGVIYDVNGETFTSLTAALNRATSEAYAYIAQQEEENALEERRTHRALQGQS